MITEIPSFLLVNEAKTPNDAVLIVKNSVVENAYPAFVVNAESARPAAAFNIEADDGYGLTQTADGIYNAGIGTFDYVSYPFAGRGYRAFLLYWDAICTTVRYCCRCCCVAGRKSKTSACLCTGMICVMRFLCSKRKTPSLTKTGNVRYGRYVRN